MTAGPPADKTEELTRIVRVVGTPTSTILQPRELSGFDLESVSGITDVVRLLLHHVGLGDRAVSIADRRTPDAPSGASLTFGEIEESGAIVVTLVELATPALTLDDLCATVADLRLETLVAADDDALDEVDCTARVVYFGLGLLVAPQPKNPDSDVTRDEWLALLAEWHSLRGERFDPSRIEEDS